MKKISIIILIASFYFFAVPKICCLNFQVELSSALVESLRDDCSHCESGGQLFVNSHSDSKIERVFRGSDDRLRKIVLKNSQQVILRASALSLRYLSQNYNHRFLALIFEYNTKIFHSLLASKDNTILLI